MTISFTLKARVLALSVLIGALDCQAQTAAKKQTAVKQQDPVKHEIDKINTPAIGLAPLRFLASDDLKGRATMRPEINIAARYISEEYRSLGLKELPGTTDYYQNFEINNITIAKNGAITINGKVYNVGAGLTEVQGADVKLNAQVIYAGHGNKDELDKLDLKGKIVITDFGQNDSTNARAASGMTAGKAKMVQDKGGIALIERVKPVAINTGTPTGRNRGGGRRVVSGKNTPPSLPAFTITDADGSLLAAVKGQPTTASIDITGSIIVSTPVKNVVAYVEGTDGKLKNEYVVLSAHYDHLGVLKGGKMEEGKLDSIYNGARDNAIGTAAVIDAARYFALHPTKRSIMFVAYTGEEIGELGSKYFASDPPVPLAQMVYNLNIDNASYNDTKLVSVIGLGRTSEDELIKKACAAYGLTALPDPAPEQNLFDRSDNTQLAVKGIPAPTFSLGMKAFDAEINKRYHQLSDEVGNFDLDYAMKYINSFILSAKYIGDDKKEIFWVKGDKYEPVWKALHNKK
jgi:hypothetical protein